MSKYIIRYLIRTRDQQVAQNVTVRALSILNALSRFSEWRAGQLPYADIEIVAIWSDADVAVRSRKKGVAA